MTKTLTLNLEHKDYRRLYAIGDVHANMNDLSTVIALIREDGYDNHVDGLFFLGDYIDSYEKGEASEVVKTIRRLSEHPDVHALRGNHEQLLIDAVSAKMYTPEFQAWWSQGGRNTYQSYIKDKEYDQWQQTLITNKQLRSDIEWFRTLPTLAISNDYIFVHAGLDPIMAEASADQDRIWIREPFLSSTRDYGKLVIHGHTSNLVVEVKPNRINIDTSKYSRVSAVRLQKDREPLFFDRYGKFKLNKKGEYVYADSSAGMEF